MNSVSKPNLDALVTQVQLRLLTNQVRVPRGHQMEGEIYLLLPDLTVPRTIIRMRSSENMMINTTKHSLFNRRTPHSPHNNKLFNNCKFLLRIFFYQNRFFFLFFFVISVITYVDVVCCIF